MRTGNQKRIKERGMVMVNFELEPEWDKELNEIAARQDRSKSAQIRIIIKDYITRNRIAK